MAERLIFELNEETRTVEVAPASRAASCMLPGAARAVAARLSEVVG